jgi:hypothetical protein
MRPDRAPQGVPAAIPNPNAPELSDHERRNEARSMGLLVPPSPGERSGLEEKGHKVPNSFGLWVP